MSQFEKDSGSDAEDEHFPVEPHYHPIHRLPRIIYDFFASAKLAMALLTIILLCCLAGVTIFRDKHAWEAIFSTLWFNGLLVLLVINVACCFFGRIWGRRITLISLGMILFHLSFVTLFLGIVYNSLFYFRGSIRLTEGETLENSRQENYDFYDHGRFFSWSRIKGSTTLNQVMYDYKVGGKDKRAAYDVTIGTGAKRVHDVLYVLKNLEYKGFKYFRDKEGFTALTILSDRQGKELFGSHIPLQSLKQNENTYLYTIGTKDGPTFLQFPPKPAAPVVEVNVSYDPDLKNLRQGKVFFQSRAFREGEESGIMRDQVLHEGKMAIGEKFPTGNYTLSVKEIRFWAAMFVRYEPGQPIVLTSLWVGLFGVILTTLARIFGRRRKITPLLTPE